MEFAASFAPRAFQPHEMRESCFADRLACTPPARPHTLLLSISSEILLHCIRACTSPFKPCCVPENKAFWACYKGARGLGDSTSLSGVLGGNKKKASD